MFLDVIDGGAGVVGLEEGFACGGVEGEDGEGGDEGGGATTGEADALSPRGTGGANFVGVAIAGAGDEIDLFA